MINKFIMLVFISFPVFSSEIFLCGNTYQDKPCAGSETKKIIKTDDQSDANPQIDTEASKRLKEMQEQTLRDADARYKAEVEAAKEAAEASEIDRKKTSAIKNHQVIEGLTKDEVIKSWGDPDRKKQVTIKYGLREEWTFVRDWGNKDYVYFNDDGVVSEINFFDKDVE